MSKIFGLLAIGVAIGLYKFIATFFGYRPETRMVYLGLAIICGVTILVLALAEDLIHKSADPTESDDGLSTPPIQSDSQQISNVPPLTNTADPVTTNQSPRKISDLCPANSVNKTDS